MGEEHLVTAEGYRKIKEELEHLRTEKRKDIAERIQRAKEMGDLSENAEYAEAKDEQAFNEGRIIELEGLLKNLKIAEGATKKGIVGMGSKITVKNGEKEKEFVIVSFNEADPLSGKISNESPIGKAFLNKKEGETVIVETPKGKSEYQIKKIS